jgi:hypothetical protein
VSLLQIKTLKNTKKNSVTKSEFSCEFCNRSFQRETTMIKHLCENKRRWQDKEQPGNRIGFQSWLNFYTKNTGTKKKKTYTDFTKSAYYIAFVKFGHYCVDIKCINVSRYADWLLKNQIKIDSWCSDKNYTSFLIEYLRTEDHMDAIARSIETTIDMSKDAGIATKDCLRYANKNRIAYAITTGKISPWMLYQSESGVEFLSNLDESQQKMIIDYINPEQWAIKFRRNNEMVTQVKELLNAAGY